MGAKTHHVNFVGHTGAEQAFPFISRTALPSAYGYRCLPPCCPPRLDFHEIVTATALANFKIFTGLMFWGIWGGQFGDGTGHGAWGWSVSKSPVVIGTDRVAFLLGPGPRRIHWRQRGMIREHDALDNFRWLLLSVCGRSHGMLL